MSMQVIKQLRAVLFLHVRQHTAAWPANHVVMACMCYLTYCRYVLSYMESMGSIKHNQTVMQIGMGGGMKAGVNVWRALRDVQEDHLAWRHLNGSPITGVGWQLSRRADVCVQQGHVNKYLHLS